MSENLLAGLNPGQREAAEVLSGPLLILAGAGSGKTRVLTQRIAHLISQGVSGDQILAVTFTNKAAKEMQGRVEKLVSGGAGRPSLGTFHSICVRILRADIEALGTQLNSNFVIFDTDDTQKLMKMIFKENQIDEKEVKLRAVLSHISSAKNQLQTPSDYQNDIEENRFTQVVRKLYPIYQRRLTEHNAVDFDDLLQKTVQVFEHKPEVLKKYQDRWQHLMVDEYQDTNFAQYRLVRLLAETHKNLCVVGDDHQSIYSFRGADFRNILDFEKDFPEAHVVKLEQNYRSTGNILNNANALISKNKTGREKNLWTENDAGQKLKISEVFDEKDEGRFISSKIRDLTDTGEVNYGDIAILYRMNAQSRAIEESLMRNQIPYQIIGGTRFFDRKEIKDILAYLRIIFNPRDDVSFLRVINTPARKIGPATIEILKKYAGNYSMSLLEILEAIDEIEELSESKKAVLREFRKTIMDLCEIKDTEPISILLDRLIEKIKYLAFLDDGTGEGEARQQNVRELFSVATRYDGAENSLATFLEGVALVADIDNLKGETESVTLMTIHASKGLEFPVVFLPGWEEGIFPSSNAQFAWEALEEERRLGYVAITRAERECFITHARQRMLFGRTDYAAPSQFLSELDDECVERNMPGMSSGGFSSRASSAPASSAGPSILPSTPKTKKEALFGVKENETEYKISDRIRHAEFGEGTIIQIGGDLLVVAFAGQGIKKIVASVAPIEKITEA